MLIQGYSERAKKAESNELLVLQTLRDVRFSDAKTLALSTKLSLSYVYKLLIRLEKKALLIKCEVPDMQLVLWGLTEHGALFAWSEDEVWEFGKFKIIEPSKIKNSRIYHELDLQKTRALALNSGWSDWQSGHNLKSNLAKRPDALARSPEGARVIVELERTVKSRKRYEVIISLYLQAIKRGEIDYVAYVIPDFRMALRMPALFRSIDSVAVGGKRVRLESRHYESFKFFHLDSWPLKESGSTAANDRGVGM